VQHLSGELVASLRIEPDEIDGVFAYLLQQAQARAQAAADGAAELPGRPITTIRPPPSAPPRICALHETSDADQIEIWEVFRLLTGRYGLEMAQIENLPYMNLPYMAGTGWRWRRLRGRRASTSQRSPRGASSAAVPMVCMAAGVLPRGRVLVRVARPSTGMRFASST
jgi:hypothetical protein